MNDDPLRTILKRADETCRPEVASAVGYLPARIRSEARRRRLRRFLAVGTCGLLVAALLPLGLLRWSRTDVATDRNPSSDRVTAGIATDVALSDEEILRLKSELAELDAEARRSQQLAEALASRSRLGELQDRLADLAAQPPVQAIADAGRDRAAQIGVIAAAALAEKLHQPVAAAESYRSVVEHFPDSRWAAVARERLDAMEHMN